MIYALSIPLYSLNCALLQYLENLLSFFLGVVEHQWNEHQLPLSGSKTSNTDVASQRKLRKLVFVLNIKFTIHKLTFYIIISLQLFILYWRNRNSFGQNQTVVSQFNALKSLTSFCKTIEETRPRRRRKAILVLQWSMADGWFLQVDFLVQLRCIDLAAPGGCHTCTEQCPMTLLSYSHLNCLYISFLTPV